MIYTQYLEAQPYANGKADVYIQDSGWNIIYTAGKRWYVSNPQFVIGEDLMLLGKWAEAAEVFGKITDDAVAVVQTQRAMYMMACEHAEKGDYEAALRCFQLAKDYLDAETRCLQMKYLIAEGYLEAGDRAKALEAFHEIADYSDAADREMQIYYDDANALREAGELEAAISVYEKCIDYLDSKAKQDETLKQRGDLLLAKGLYDDAALLYEIKRQIKRNPKKPFDKKKNPDKMGYAACGYQRKSNCGQRSSCVQNVCRSGTGCWPDVIFLPDGRRKHSWNTRRTTFWKKSLLAN